MAPVNSVEYALCLASCKSLDHTKIRQIDRSTQQCKMRWAASQRPACQHRMSRRNMHTFWMLCLRSGDGHINSPLAAAQCEPCAAPCWAMRDGSLCFGSSCSLLHSRMIIWFRQTCRGHGHAGKSEQGLPPYIVVQETAQALGCEQEEEASFQALRR